MLQSIIENLQSPIALERLYQSDKKSFRNAIFQALEERPHEPALQFWHARFTVEADKVAQPINWSIVVLISLIVGLVLELPKLLDWNEDQFYPKYIGIAVFGGLSYLFLALKNANKLLYGLVTASLLLALGYLQVIPQFVGADTTLLLVLHLTALLAFVFAIAYLGNRVNGVEARIQWLKFAGDLVLMSGLLLLGFMLFTGLSMGLFNSLRVDAGYYFGKYVVVWLLAPIPLLAAALVHSNRQLVSKISPLIASLFSPLALLSLVTFLLTYFASGTQTLRDRDFLLLFNAILLAVLALIFFSVANQPLKTKSFQVIILFLLGIVAVCVNVVALVAILERISTYGMSPNKLAVLGSNLLILLHLGLVVLPLGKSAFLENSLEGVEKRMVQFLPIYALWLLFVLLAFPAIFVN